MRSRPALAPVAVGVIALLVGVVLLFVPFLDLKREVIASTPATLSPNEQATLGLKPNDQVCASPVPLDSHSQLLRFGVVTGGKRGGPLVVTATAPGGVGTTAAVPGGYREGPVEVPLRAQSHDVLGRICVRNTGQRTATLLSTPFGRRFAPVQTSVNGKPVEQDVPMTLHARKPASLASRVSPLIAHVSVVQPLPAWVLWLLLAAVLLALPAAAFAAVAAAAAAPAGAAPDPRTSAPPVPLAGAGGRVARPVARTVRRVSARVAALPDGWLIGGLVVLAAGFLYFWASRTATFQLDENQYVYLARWIDHDSSAIFNFELFMRGLQRLEVWLLSIPLGIMRSPDAFFAAHALNSLAFASVSIPMFLVARGLGTGRRWALLAALLGVAVPWTVYATSFLTEPLAYPLSMWVIWAIWRAVARPTIGSEVVALVLLLAAGLARSAFLVLVPVLPLAVLAQELRYGGWRQAAGVRARIGAFAGGLWTRHRVVTIVIVGGAAALALTALGALPALRNLSGGYGTPWNVIWSPFFDKIALYASRVTVGLGFIPFAVGVPWLAREVVVPRDARRNAFAVTALLAAALILYASASAGPDERYAIYLAPPIVVAAVVACARREIGPLLVGAGGLLAALLIWRHGWNPNGGPYGFFIGPAESFYARVGLLRLGGHTPFAMSVQDFAFVLTLALAGVCAYAFTRRPRAGIVLGVLIGLLVVLQLTQAEYSISKYVNQAGARATATPKQRAWIDAAIYGKAKASIFATGQGNSGTWDPTWRELQFWNTSLFYEHTNGARAIQVPIGDRAGTISYDPRTGALSSDPPLPPYVVLPRSYVDVGPAATAVAHASYVAADLWKLDKPHQVRYVVTGPVEDGLVAPGTKVRVRVFSAGLGAGTRWCAGLPLFQPVAVDGRKVPLHYRASGPGGTRTGTIPAAVGRTVTVPLETRAGAPYEDIELTMRGPVKITPDRTVAGQLGQVWVNRCP